LIEAGLKAAIMLVFALPPRYGLSKNVSFDSRYGTTASAALLVIVAFFASVLITLPRTLREALIFAPSASRSPVAPVLPARSEPAKSIRLILLTRLFKGVPSASKKF